MDDNHDNRNNGRARMKTIDDDHNDGRRLQKQQYGLETAGKHIYLFIYILLF